MTDRFNNPKGFAYVEFLEPDAVQNAVLLNESELNGRKLKVRSTNKHAYTQFTLLISDPVACR